MIALLVFLPFVIVYGLMAVYLERKISGFIQDRMGPMEVGPYGLLQTAADILKLLLKEGIVPKAVDKPLFLLAPLLVFVSIFAGFAVMPAGPTVEGAALSVGVFFLLAIVSLDVMGILMAGWGSNSKYALYGAIRSVSQIVSYEIPVGLSVLCVVMISQSLDLQEISYQQGIWAQWYYGEESSFTNMLFGITNIDVSQVGGFLTWNIFRMPLLGVAYVIFFIATLAEANRAPFDLPEAESELIGGYHTEYSGFRFAIFMLSEYAMMLLVGFLGAVLFLGSWNSPLPNIGPVALAKWTSGEPGTLAASLWGGFWLFGKALAAVLVQMWIRWTYPRLRVDQLMNLCWKYLIPACLILVVVCGIWRLMMI